LQKKNSSDFGRVAQEGEGWRASSKKVSIQKGWRNEIRPLGKGGLGNQEEARRGCF